VAALLFVSEPTIKTHINLLFRKNRLFRKISVRDRFHAVVLAYETGLLHPGIKP
jgi:DNA-binding CsgD family transcriptional regulator